MLLLVFGSIRIGATLAGWLALSPALVTFAFIHFPIGQWWQISQEKMVANFFTKLSLTGGLLDRASSFSCTDEENYGPIGLQMSAGRDHVAHESGSP